MGAALYEMSLRVTARGDSAEHVRNLMMEYVGIACGSEWSPEEWTYADLQASSSAKGTPTEWKGEGHCRIMRLEGRHG